MRHKQQSDFCGAYINLRPTVTITVTRPAPPIIVTKTTRLTRWVVKTVTQTRKRIVTRTVAKEVLVSDTTTVVVTADPSTSMYTSPP